MNKRNIGILATAGSAIIFGFTPILTRITYDGGANGITITFLRGLLALPILLIILRIQHISLFVTKRQIKDIAFAGLIGATATTVLLYMSYSYVNVGTATSLHFVYPLLVAIGAAVFYKEKLNAKKIIAIALGTLGVLLFFDAAGMQNKVGIVLALCSGVTYAFYMLYLEKSSVRYLHYYVLTLYLCVVMAASTGIGGILTGTLKLNITPKAWAFAAIVSLFTSVGALALLQIGIRYTGATSAAVFSTLEPITSVALSVMMLGEKVTVFKLIGIACIITSVLFVAFAEPKQSRAEDFIAE